MRDVNSVKCTWGGERWTCEIFGEDYRGQSEKETEIVDGFTFRDTTMTAAQKPTRSARKKRSVRVGFRDGECTRAGNKLVCAKDTDSIVSKD